MTTNLVLHVGLQKTATTTMQRTLFAQHSDIFYLGKYRSSAARKGCRNNKVYKLLAPAIWKQTGTFDVEALRNDANEVVVPEAQGKAVTIGSWESLGSVDTPKYTEMLRRLACVFGDLRVMFCLRNPVNWLRSLYLQELQGHFRKRNRQHLGFNSYVEFEEWLEVKGERLNNHGGRLSYADNIRESIELFGKDRVGVFVYEDLLADSAAYYTGICEFLGIDVDEALQLTRGKSFNPTLTDTQLQLLRETQSSFLKRLFWSITSRRLRTRTLNAVAGEDCNKVRVQVPQSTISRIESGMRDTNRWLATEFDLPLDKYGYPM